MSFLIIGVFAGAAYGLLAVGFVLIYRGTRVFNLAHGEMGALGLYCAWALLPHLPLGLAVICGVLVAAACGLAIERGLVRRMHGRGPLAALATTLGAGLTLAYVEALIWGFNIKTFPSPFGEHQIRIFGATITSARIGALAIAGITALGLAAFLKRTRFGLQVSASTSDPALARLSGIPVARTRAFVWVLGGALSGIAAILIASVETFHPLSVTLVMVRALAAAMLGGLDSIAGAFVGGIAIGVVESMVTGHTTLGGGADLAVFAVLLGTLLLRPRGILGTGRA